MANLQKLASCLTCGLEGVASGPLPTLVSGVGKEFFRFVLLLVEFLRVLSRHMWLLLSVPVFAHSYAVGLSCAAVAVSVCWSAIVLTVVVVVEVPCLAACDWFAASVACWCESVCDGVGPLLS